MFLKSGKGKKAYQISTRRTAQSSTHSGPSGRDALGVEHHLGPVGAMKQAGRDIRTAGLHGTGIEGAVVGLQKMPARITQCNAHTLKL